MAKCTKVPRSETGTPAAGVLHVHERFQTRDGNHPITGKNPRSTRKGLTLLVAGLSVWTVLFMLESLPAGVHCNTGAVASSDGRISSTAASLTKCYLLLSEISKYDDAYSWHDDSVPVSAHAVCTVRHHRFLLHVYSTNHTEDNCAVASTGGSPTIDIATSPMEPVAGGVICNFSLTREGPLDLGTVMTSTGSLTCNSNFRIARKFRHLDKTRACLDIDGYVYVHQGNATSDLWNGVVVFVMDYPPFLPVLAVRNHYNHTGTCPEHSGRNISRSQRCKVGNGSIQGHRNVTLAQGYPSCAKFVITMPSGGGHLAIHQDQIKIFKHRHLASLSSSHVTVFLMNMSVSNFLVRVCFLSPEIVNTTGSYYLVIYLSHGASNNLLGPLEETIIHNFFVTVTENSLDGVPGPETETDQNITESANSSMASTPNQWSLPLYGNQTTTSSTSNQTRLTTSFGGGRNPDDSAIATILTTPPGGRTAGQLAPYILLAVAVVLSLALAIIITVCCVKKSLYRYSCCSTHSWKLRRHSTASHSSSSDSETPMAESPVFYTKDSVRFPSVTSFASCGTATLTFHSTVSAGSISLSSRQQHDKPSTVSFCSMGRHQSTDNTTYNDLSTEPLYAVMINKDGLPEDTTSVAVGHAPSIALNPNYTGLSTLTKSLSKNSPSQVMKETSRYVTRSKSTVSVLQPTGAAAKTQESADEYVDMVLRTNGSKWQEESSESSDYAIVSPSVAGVSSRTGHDNMAKTLSAKDLCSYHNLTAGQEALGDNISKSDYEDMTITMKSRSSGGARERSVTAPIYT